MFKPQNRIIIVDDNLNELNTLTQSFLENGIGCRPFQYINTYDEPLENVRIAFFDINLAEKKIDDTGKTVEEAVKLNTPVYNDLAIAINQYIHKENGPFALFFWTKNSLIKDGFIEFMQDAERGFATTASPFFVGCIDKTEFNGDDVHSKLSKKLLEVLNNEKIKFLFDFEQNARISGERTINKIFEIIPKDDKWGNSEKSFENIGKVLSKIAAATLGFEHSKDSPSKAIYEGLIPLLNNELIRIESDVNWEQLLAPLYEAAAFDRIVSPDDLIQRKVNAVFHIESSNGNKDVRGAVIQVDKTNVDLLATLNIVGVDEWFNKIIPFHNDKNAIKKEIRKGAELVAIEISAACDYSNKKKRINKYILGFKTPIIDIKADIDEKNRIESSYHLGGANFHYNNQDFQIWLNLNFVFGTKCDDQRLGNILFVLKKEIMDMIGNKYASHISRIGITSF
jgi:hypothetical protein